ncbi:MAG: ATP-binding protein, partial [Bacillota bacterium]
GTLFMDELPEFNRDVLEMLRQPLEEGEVTIVRSALTATFPADFTLLAAMNPCPCGYYGDKHHQCTCSLTRINRYRNKISGPLLDRIDIHIEVPSLEVSEIISPADGESSRAIKARVIRAHNYQQQRYQQERFNHNSQLAGASLGKYCSITDKGKVMLEEAIERLGLSARAYDRVLKLARTIADLEETSSIKTDHLAEAIQYRSFDRKL